MLYKSFGRLNIKSAGEFHLLGYNAVYSVENLKHFEGQTLADRGVGWSAQRIPTAVNLGFLDRSRYFSIQVTPQLSSRG
jgi:hypothetical protein